MPVLVIRHAQARPRKGWSKDDRMRPLTPKGDKVAAALVETVAPFAPQRVLSSPYIRCIQTVEPLALASGLRVEICPELAEGSEGAAALVRSLVNEKVALCTHGDVIPDVLVALADEERVDLGHRPKQAKGSVWVLEPEDGHFSRATYIPPPGD